MSWIPALRVSRPSRAAEATTGWSPPWPAPWSPVADQLHGHHRAQAPDLPDDRWRSPQVAQPPLPEDVAHPPGPLQQVALLEQLDGGQRGHTRQRVAAVGAAQPARAGGVHQLGPPGDRGQGQPGGDRLGRDGEVGDHARVLLGGVQGAGAAEARLDLVGHERDLQAPAHVGDPLHPAGRWGDEAALALHRLDDQAGHVLGADVDLDLLLDVVGAGQAAGRRAEVERAAVAVGVGHAEDLARERLVALLVRGDLAGHGQGEQGAAVEGVVEHDHAGAAGGGAGDLDHVLGRLGPEFTAWSAFRSRRG